MPTADYDRLWPGQVQSIERAAAILRLLASGPRRLGLGEVAASLGLAKGTTHGILRTLQNVDFVEQDPATGKYQLGAALLHLGTSYLDVNELRSRSINWADALAARSGEAVRLGTPLEGQVLIVHHVFRPDDTLQTLDVGALLPLHASRSARCCWPSARRRGRCGGRAGGVHPAHPGRPGALTPALAEVRELGWARRSTGNDARARPASPRRSGATAAWWWARSASPARWSGSATPQGPGRPSVTQVRDAARAISRDLGAARW